MAFFAKSLAPGMKIIPVKANRVPRDAWPSAERGTLQIWLTAAGFDWRVSAIVAMSMGSTIRRPHTEFSIDARAERVDTAALMVMASAR